MRTAALVLVGWKALLDLAAGELRNLMSLARYHCVPVVGFADQMAEHEHRQALRSGITALYAIPIGAEAYADTVRRILDEWLAPSFIRRDSAPRPGLKN
jgi:hypothetical protein